MNMKKNGGKRPITDRKSIFSSHTGPDYFTRDPRGDTRTDERCTVQALHVGRKDVDATHVTRRPTVLLQRGPEKVVMDTAT